MRELTILREVNQRQAASANGRHVYNPIHQDAHAKFAAYDLDHLSMPIDTTDQTLLQDSSGNPLFMLGQSALDGPDPLA